MGFGALQTWCSWSQFCQHNRDCNVLQSPEFGSLLLVTPGKLHELSFAILLILEIPGYLFKVSAV